MPNQITSTGLEVKTREELLAEFTAAYQAIYGSDINLDADSPDGQMMNIYIQAILDVEDLLVQIYNSFDPDNAIGVTLDQRVTYNGIQRQAGTYTITPIQIVTSRACNLYGLDQEANPIYTVSDNAGNEWELVSSYSFSGADTQSLSFRSKVPGAVLTTPNTITTPVTIVLGVTSVNNPTTYTTLGINEETDAELKIRRLKSVSLASQGYLAALLAALENINGVTTAQVYENNTDSTDGDGTPSHSIWVIVAGGTSAEIAQAIYKKRNAGCGMRGDQSYVITQVDGTPFEVLWDNVEAEDLFIKFTVTSLDGINPPNIAAIRAGLVTSLAPGVGVKVNVNELATLVQDIDPNTLVTNAGFSTTVGGSYTTTLSPTAKNKQFTVSSAKIIILPVTVSPAVATISVSTTKQLTAYGGYGAYTWSVQSGTGSVDSSGLYTATGASTTAVVRATDTLGNYGEATITVV